MDCEHCGREIEKIKERLGKGDVNLSTLDIRTKDTHDVVMDMNKRFFVDNGSKCVQTRINATEAVVGRLVKITWILCGGFLSTLLSIGGRLIYLWITT